MSKPKPPAIMLYKDFYRKGRNVRWMIDNGWGAIAILQCVWIESSDERDCKMKREDILAIPFLSRFDGDFVVAVLDSAVAEGLLEEKNGFYFNSTTAEEHEHYVTKQKNYKKGHKKRQQKSERIQDESRLNSERNQNENKLNYNECELLDVSTDYDLKKNGLTQYSDHCWASSLTVEMWQASKGKQFVDRCFEKLNGWIEQSRGDPIEFQNRRKIGRSGVAGAFQSWVFATIGKEQAEAEKINKHPGGKKTKFEQNMETLFESVGND